MKRKEKDCRGVHIYKNKGICGCVIVGVRVCVRDRRCVSEQKSKLLKMFVPLRVCVCYVFLCVCERERNDQKK